MTKYYKICNFNFCILTRFCIECISSLIYNKLNICRKICNFYDYHSILSHNKNSNTSAITVWPSIENDTFCEKIMLPFYVVHIFNKLTPLYTINSEISFCINTTGQINIACIYNIRFFNDYVSLQFNILVLNTSV